MPATFPSHAAAVLGLKLWRPHRFDGVALAVGAAAPDLAYPLAGLVMLPDTHTPPALLWFCLPVTLLVTWLVRRAAPTVAAHLPHWPARLALRDYGVLGLVRHPWPVTAWSALLGAASHLAWDGLTHDPRGDWLSEALATVQRDRVFGLPWWTVVDQGSTVLGALAVLGVVVHIGRRRRLRQWHGEPPHLPARAPWLFWSSVLAVLVIYPVTWPLLPYRWAAHVQGVRALWITGLALLAAVAVTRAVNRRRSELALPAASAQRPKSATQAAGWRGDRVSDRTRHNG